MPHDILCCLFLIQPPPFTLHGCLYINGYRQNVDLLLSFTIMTSCSKNASPADKQTMGNTLLKNLKAGVREATVCCRVSRMWDCINPMSHNQLISVDLLFVDEEGSCIQATVRPRDAQWVKETLEEGSVYICTGFIVIAATNNYRVCMNPDIISLSRRTTRFKQCYSEDLLIFHLHSFSFLEFDALVDRVGDNQYLTDVIGELTSISPIDQIYVKNVPVEKRTIQLQNTSGAIISATLWTTVAHQINDYHVQALMKQGSIIIILAAMSVTRFNGQLGLGSKSATKVYMNLSDPATTIFKLALKGSQEITFTPLGLTLEEQINHNRRTVEELLHLTPPKAKGIKFTCATKIKDILPFNGWWFPACPHCKKKVNTANEIYWCDNCNSYVDDTPEHWYKLDLVIQDHTADRVFMMIGTNAEHLVGQSARELALKNPDPLILPDAIKKLRGVSKIFEIELMFSRKSKHTFKVIRTFDAIKQPDSSTEPKQRSTTLVEDECHKKPKFNSSSSGSTSSNGSPAYTE